MRIHYFSAAGASATSGRLLAFVWTGSTMSAGIIARMVEAPGSSLIWPATAPDDNGYLTVNFGSHGQRVRGIECEVISGGTILAYMLDF